MAGLQAACKDDIRVGTHSQKGEGSDGRWSRRWRVVVSGFSFALFMVIAMLLAILVFPMVRLFSRSREQSQSRVRAVIHYMFGWVVNFWASLPVMHPPRIEGVSVLRAVGPCIIVANHPTLIDAVLLGGVVPDFNCVAKPSLRDHRFLGGPIRAAGYVASEDATEIIRQCREGFARGQSLIIFPEGSRSFENGLRPFSRGAAQLAVRTGLPVVPVVIRCDPPTLMKHQRWYEIPPRPFQLSVRFHAPMQVACDRGEAPESVSRRARRFNLQLEAFFRKELGIDSEHS